jgi:hypothetical protein
MKYTVAHDVDARRFTTTVEGHLCVLEYRLAGSTMTITFTGVPTAVGGRGIAAALTRAALNEAKTAGWKVVPTCTYAAAFMRRHPEYR